MPVCIICRTILEKDEIALTKKLINRGTENFMCIKCLAQKFDVTEETLQEKILQYREMGCTLFR